MATEHMDVGNHLKAMTHTEASEPMSALKPNKNNPNQSKTPTNIPVWKSTKTTRTSQFHNKKRCA
jgi:ribosomal protein L39E